MGGDLVDIGEVLSHTGLPASTLHYYERHGLVRSVERAGLRRQYEPGTIDRLAVIVLCQKAGFRLQEIAELLANRGGPAREALVRAKQTEVRARLQALEVIESGLSHALSCSSDKLLGCEHSRADLDAVIPLKPKDYAPSKPSPGKLSRAGKPSTAGKRSPSEPPGQPSPTGPTGPTGPPGPPVTVQHLSNLAWLRRVRDRIDREYAEPLDVEALAHGVHMSAGHLSREFKLAYGESPYSYLMTRRVERAMALLRRGDLSVTEVCFAVGCSSLGTFSTRFTELVGAPPSAYRRYAANATAGIPPCVEKQVTRPVRNREAQVMGPLVP